MATMNLFKVSEELVVDWNKLYPVGTPVVLTDDFGKKHKTKTRSIAWVAGTQAIVSVEGRTGGYSLYRIKADEETSLDCKEHI